MAEGTDQGGLGLTEAIEERRDALLEARSSGATSEIQLPIESMTIELKVVATGARGGKAGFRVPVVELEVGGSGERKREETHTVTVVFGEPVDRQGRPVKVAEASNERKG